MSPSAWCSTRGQQPARVRINRELLDQVIALADEVRQRLKTEAPRPDGLLAVRGVVELAEEEDLSEDKREARIQQMSADFTKALAALAQMRREEGARLAAIVAQQLNDIERFCTAAAASAAAQPAGLQARAQAADWTCCWARRRLCRRSGWRRNWRCSITKADVREELDRLGVHIAAARELLEGRRRGRPQARFPLPGVQPRGQHALLEIGRF